MSEELSELGPPPPPSSSREGPRLPPRPTDPVASQLPFMPMAMMSIDFAKGDGEPFPLVTEWGTICPMAVVKDVWTHRDLRRIMKDKFTPDGLVVESDLSSSSGVAPSFKLFGEEEAENFKGISFIANLAGGKNVFHMKIKQQDEERVLKTVVINYLNPQVNDQAFRILPILILCKDSSPDVKHEVKEKIALAMKLMQSYFEEQIVQHGFQRRTFLVDQEVAEVSFDLTKAELENTTVDKVWGNISELMSAEVEQPEGERSLWDPRRLYVAFVMDGCKISKKEGEKHNVACTLGKLTVIGLNTYSTWPGQAKDIFESVKDSEFLSGELDTISMMMMCRDKTRGSLYCATMGALAHELGHMLGLGHSQGIMGNTYSRFDEFLFPRTALKFNDIVCGGNRAGESMCNLEKGSPIGLSHSGATIIYTHKWLCDPFGTDNSQIRSVDFNGRELVSENDLAVAELRTVESQYVFRTYYLTEGTRHLRFFKNDIPGGNPSAMLFASDWQGNSFKCLIKRSQLPNGVTTVHRPIPIRRLAPAHFPYPPRGTQLSQLCLNTNTNHFNVPKTEENKSPDNPGQDQDQEKQLGACSSAMPAEKAGNQKEDNEQKENSFPPRS